MTAPAEEHTVPAEKYPMPAAEYPMPAGEHTVQRPSWDCGHCDEPWPCISAREALNAELDQVSLAMYMDTHLAESLGELPAAAPAELFDRFLGWAR